MTEFKNQMYFALYALQGGIYEIKLLLFRAYLFMVFALRLGGAIVIAAAAGGAFYALKNMETNLLSKLPDWGFSRLQGFRDAVLYSDWLYGIYVPSFEYGYEIVVALIATGVFLVLRVTARVVAPVVYAFPMPRRPLEPILKWIPPEHKIHAVKASIAAPKRRVTRRGSDLQKIIARLPDNLQALLRLDAPQEGLQAAQRAVSRSALPKPVESASVCPVPATAEVAQPARPKRKPAAPPLPPRAHA